VKNPFYGLWQSTQFSAYFEAHSQISFVSPYDVQLFDDVNLVRMVTVVNNFCDLD
jgi:hypothetical protein